MKIHSFVSAAAVTLLLVSCGGNRQSTTGEIAASSSTAVIQTEQGLVAGYIEDGVYIYKGIPYAKAERFMPPTAPDSWEGVRSSRAYGPTCPQGTREGWQSDEQAFAFNWDDGHPGEDCLRVNIWTPGINDGGKRPVMVWLHGGGYSAGSGQELPSYDGTNLAKNNNVVVVSLNHRLNVLGFLDLSAYGEQYAHSGNVGLLDLVAALNWVNRNIEGFGGDPSNVTIFGQSGGGGKVSTLLATPMAAGLFQKAIIESGSMINTMESKYSRLIAAELLNELGLKPSQVDKLKDLPYEQLLEAGNRAVEKARAKALEDGVSPFIFGWAPTVDGDILPCQPAEPEAWTYSKDIPLIIGTTKQEFCASTYVPFLRDLTEDQAVEFLTAKYGDRTQEFLDAFTQAYPEHTPNDLIDTDLMFRPNALAQAEVKLGVGGAPLYMYLFEWESPVLDGSLRASHCMEIPFVFDNAVRHATMTGGGQDAVELAGKMSGAWVNFARTGIPNADGLPQWEPYDENGATMFFGEDCRLEHSHDKVLMAFVRSIPARGL